MLEGKKIVANPKESNLGVSIKIRQAYMLSPETPIQEFIPKIYFHTFKMRNVPRLVTEALFIAED